MRSVLGTWNHVAFGNILGLPLPGTAWPLDELPLVTKEHVEVAVVPLRWARRPGAFDATADRVFTDSRAVAVLPTKPLLGHAGTFRLTTDILLIGCRTVALSERMPTGCQGNGLFIIHRHACKGLADIPTFSNRIRFGIGAFRIDVDQAHLDSPVGILQNTITFIALVTKPVGFDPPIDVLLGFPDILASTTEAEGLEAHRFQSAVAGEDHQIGPRELAAILLLDWPEKSTGLVQIRIVRPTVEWRESLGSSRSPTTTVEDSIRSSAVPGHANEERTIVAVISWPPVLGIRHQGIEVLLDRFEIKRLKGLGIVEISVHRIGQF